jgi:hypothetical protein
MFVAWCDSDHHGKSPQAMQLEALQQLSETYAAALSLPGVDHVEAPEPPSETLVDRTRLANNLRSLPLQYYLEVFTPSDLDGNEGPVCGDLFDDFIDIYGDLMAGLWLYDRKHLESAVFSWSFTFGVHWGRHAVSAMHALHSFEPGSEAQERSG